MGLFEPYGRYRDRDGRTGLVDRPMARFRTLDDLGDISGQRALVRVDLNVPMGDLAVTDDTRLRATLPTVSELSDRGAIVLLLAHFGRPKGQMRPDMSLSLVTRAYGEGERKSTSLNSS